MRIRGTKPEFWRSKRIASVDWGVVYDGPIPKRVNEVAPAASTHEYVYLIFTATDELIYVGRSFRPADRFTKHRRKPWWREVDGTVILRVNEIPRYMRPPWETAGPNTVRLEALLIAEFTPRGNIAAPAKGAMR